MIWLLVFLYSVISNTRAFSPTKYPNKLSSSVRLHRFETPPKAHCRPRYSHKSRHIHSVVVSLASGSHDDTSPSEDGASYNWTRPTLIIALPALIGMMADPLLSLMDTAFVGNVVGRMELASLGACTSIFHLAFNAFRATTQATTSLVGSSLKTSEQEAQHVTLLSMQFGIALGLLLGLFLYSQGTWCLARMGITSASALYKPAYDYLQTRAFAAPAVLAIVVAEGAFRGHGNTKIPLLASGVAAFVNLVLDPLFMLPPLSWGTKGAALATALAQLAGALVYGMFLKRKKMLPQPQAPHAPYQVQRAKVFQTILGANVAMMAKQGSLLLAWAYATAKATRLGPAHVAAHQIALSYWLLFALLLDGAAVSAQVLMSQALGSIKKVRSLMKYMLRFATLQGLGSSALILASGTMVTHLFTPDVTIRQYLALLVPHLGLQQVLISLTLVLESLAVGGQQFNLLAVGTTLSTVVAMTRLQHATSIVSIWSQGIVTLFCGRLLTAIVGCARIYGVLGFSAKPNEKGQTVVEPTEKDSPPPEDYAI